MGSKEQQGDLDQARSEWAQAANRRLESMRNKEWSPMPYLKETANDLNLRRLESNDNPENPMSNLTGSGGTTKARLLDWEQAAKQAQDPNAPLPAFNQNAELPK